jgi:uncharacterized protein (TIGR03067 family)
MNTLRILIVVVAGLLAGRAVADEAPALSKALQGRWVVTAAERDGKPAEDIKGHQVVFDGDRFTITTKDGKLDYQGTYRLDGSSKPNAIDFMHTLEPLKGKKWLGILQREGDTLKICDNAPNPEKPRPESFTTKPASGYVSVTLQRKK